MFDILLKSKFYTKSKSAIKLTKTRIEMIKRKRNAMQKYLKNDVVDLLKNGLDTNAYGRAEGLWNELNLTSCYEFVEKFCAHISSHLSGMNKQRECPEDCREAVASLMFAAARFADLPELRDLRAIYTERYGNFIECYANKEFVNKLKAAPPTKDMKLQFMQDIASEFGIEWNSKALEQKLYNLPNALAQDRAKSEKNDGSNPESMDDSAEMIANKGTGHPRGFTGPGKKIEEPPSPERKELADDENNSPKKRGKVMAEGRHQSSRAFNGAEDSKDIKHGQEERSKGQQNESQNIRSTSGEEEDEKPFYYKPFRPPYTKSRMGMADSSLTEPPSTEATEHAKTPGQIDKEDKLHQVDTNGRVIKPVPKSVRRRFLKPQPVTDHEDKKTGRQRRKDLDQDPSDEEESKLDWLLSYYSKKKQSSNGRKSEPVIKPSSQQAAANNTAYRDMKDTGGKDGPPPRIASLPNEPSSVESPRKAHARAASFQAESCHVHPKLPDYDDFLARLAALRRN